MKTSPVISFLALISFSFCFEVIEKSPTAPIKLSAGETLTLSATSDLYYRRCTIKSPDGKSCELFFEKPDWNAQIFNCDSLNGRIDFVGQFYSRNCAVNVKNVTEFGNWEIELEMHYNLFVTNHPDKATANYTVENVRMSGSEMRNMDSIFNWNILSRIVEKTKSFFSAFSCTS